MKKHRSVIAGLLACIALAHWSTRPNTDQYTSKPRGFQKTAVAGTEGLDSSLQSQILCELKTANPEGREALKGSLDLLIRRLARESPSEGLQFILQLERSGPRRQLLLVFGTELAASNLPLAKSLLEKLLDTSSPAREAGDYTGFAQAVLCAEVSRSFDSGLDLLARIGQKGGNVGDYLMDLTAKLSGIQKHEEILKLAEKFPKNIEPPLLGNALFNVWKTNPDAVRQTLAGLPDEDIVAQAYTPMVGALAKEDLNQALEWIESMQAGKVRDSSVVGVAQTLSHTDPLRAAQFLTLMEDEKNS